MCRKIYIIGILIFSTNLVFGQGLKFGIFFDPVVTWWKSDVKDVTAEKVRMGFDFGISADYYFSKNYAFATGISLFNMGGTLRYMHPDFILQTKDENVPIDLGTAVRYRIKYIKVPLALKFKTHRIGRVVYSANLGFDPMMRISARVDFNDVKDVSAPKEANLFNLGWHFGAGAQYSLGGEVAFFGGLTFMNTFTDITRPAHDGITSNNLSFCIGVMF